MQAVYTDVDTEYRSLRENSGLIVYTGTGLFRVSGPGAPALLNSVCARSVDFLLEGQILTTLALNDEGAVIAELLLHCNGTDYLVEVWPSQREVARTHLEKLAAGCDDLELTDVSDSFRVFGLEGPGSFRIAQKFLSFSIASMGYGSFMTESYRGESLLLSRTGVTGEYGYKFHVPEGLASELGQELSELGARECGQQALDICRMEMRFVNLERESGGETVTPFDVGLQWMADFQHDFLGRDALQEQSENQRWTPVCWTAEDSQEPPVTGSSLATTDTVVGTVTHAVLSPGLGYVIGTARVDTRYAASGLQFQIEETGQNVATISPPFRVPSSFGVPLE